uniref:Tyrosine-protein kinase n=1 Tax=Esox lucius TaxID=8010 RepID=A0A3P8XKU1_ESOLU
MPPNSAMEVGRQLLGKMMTRRKGEISVPVIAQGLEVHFYLGDCHQLKFLRGCFTAEELCTEAARKCGISPLCFNLFALCDEGMDLWYPPNHIFKIEESTCLKLHYRMRFYFTNWHGLNECAARVCRHALKGKNGSEPKSEPGGSPLLDASSLKYLFAQSQRDFQKGRAAVRNVENEAEAHNIENECLGMAVLSLSHHAMDKNISIPDLAKQISYKKYIPDNVNQIIDRHNCLTRLRISRVFRRFLSEFNNNTVQSNNISTHDIRVKYLSTLETLTTWFGCEVFEPEVLRVMDSEGEIEGTPLSFKKDQPAQYQVLVSGNTGIKWRRKQQNSAWTAIEKKTSKKNKYKISSKNQPAQDVSSDWKSFSELNEITHINIKGCTVTVHKQDNKKMELSLGFHAEALSFAALIDGYFRLTVDAHHFLCTDVAPPSVVRNLQEGCHGPINMDYTAHKLSQEGGEEGLYVLRWSCIDYDHILLTVACNQVDQTDQRPYRNFKIQVGPGGYDLIGTSLKQPSLKKLMEQLTAQSLRTDRVTLRLQKACPPQPREISNLLLVTKREVEPTCPTQSQLIFHRILKEDIVQEEHLGCGTRTNIYAGTLKIKSDGETDLWGSQKDHEVKVVLKELGSQHRDISMAFLEMVSMMREVSHQHIALLHGVWVRNQDCKSSLAPPSVLTFKLSPDLSLMTEPSVLLACCSYCLSGPSFPLALCASTDILVEEHVRLGPLDVFMRQHRLQLSTSWKFEVAQQLTSALSYLEDKKLVHGYISAKNILVERAGLDGKTGPFIKLSGPVTPIYALNRQECVERIPWIAPECLEEDPALSVAVDKWGFGATLWEICYEGEVPLKDKKLIEKEMFYSAQCSLVTPDCPQLAELIKKCMAFDPKRRPFFRAIVRDLTGVAEQNPDILPRGSPANEEDPTVFETRFLRKIKDLGEGHFGKVELCRYDPCGDGRGELVAVKSLKPESRGQLGCHLRREVDTMRELYHQNIVKYKGVCSEEGGRTTKLIMEYLPAGSLKEYLPRRRDQTDLRRLLHYALQICQGMDYLGSHRFIHRDLAARNVLVENESTVKIGDFGLTKSMKEDKSYYTVKEVTDSPVFWYAPECLLDCKFYTASDVWSFGVTLYELMTYCETSSSPTTVFLEMLRPTQGQMTLTRLVEMLRAGRRLPCPSHCPESVYSLMRRCWEIDQENRIQFKELVTELEELLFDRHRGDGLFH